MASWDDQRNPQQIKKISTTFIESKISTKPPANQNDQRNPQQIKKMSTTVIKWKTSLRKHCPGDQMKITWTKKKKKNEHYTYVPVCQAELPMLTWLLIGQMLSIEVNTRILKCTAFGHFLRKLQRSNMSQVSTLDSFEKALQKCRVEQSVRGKAKRSVIHDRSHL